MSTSTLDQLRASPRMARFFHPDGTFVSVRGGSDGDAPAPAANATEFIAQQFAAAEEPAAETPAAEAPGEGAAPDAPASAPADGEPPASGEARTFDEKYVKELRDEAAKYRTQYAPFRDTFEGFGEEDVQAFLSLAADLRDNPEAAARRMFEASRALAGDDFEKWITGNTEPAPLTREDLERELAEREQQRELERMVEQVHKDVEGLGYKRGTYEFNEVLYRANNEHGGDLKAAHEAMQAYRQRLADEFLAEKAKKNSAFPAAAGGGSAPQGQEPPAEGKDSFAVARDRMEAMLRGAPGQ